MSDPTTAQILLPDGTPMVFCRIPAGSFRMGSRGNLSREEPVTRVRIAHPFWIGETPVTQRQFAVWTRACRVGHSNTFGSFPDSPRHPAENLDWRQANRFCHWLGAEVTVPEIVRADGVSLFCLPTEAEWEYACRAGTETEYHTGDGEEALADAGWYDGNAGGSTRPVGLKRPNAWGLYDAHGNVWEWCHDVWDEGAYRLRPEDEEDPAGELRGRDWAARLGSWLDANPDRVVRGGSWNYSAWGCRSARRDWGGPDVRGWGRGFRVCLVRGPADLKADRKAERGTAGAGKPQTRDESEAHGTGRPEGSFDLELEGFPREAGRKFSGGPDDSGTSPKPTPRP